MKYQIGQIVKHRLTGDEMIIIATFPGKEYQCRLYNYSIVVLKEIEICD